MAELFINLLASAIAAIFGATWYPIYLTISGIFSPDLPKLSGTYDCTYKERDAQRNLIEINEIIQVKQVGRNLFGEITRPDDPALKFKFRASIRRQLVTGEYWPTPRPAHATGVGSFQVKCMGNDDHLIGRCIWLDFDTSQVEASRYEWKKR